MKTSNASNSRIESRRDRWRALVAHQKQSGLSVRAFCAQQGLREHAFYDWRKRLRGSSSGPLRFALVEAPGVGRASAVCLELHLGNGERLAIGAGVDAATLRMVLEALRERA